MARSSNALLLSIITGAAGYNSLFIGHSFFVPISTKLANLAVEVGVSHGHQSVFSGGASGTPTALWNSEEHRNATKAILDGGDIELLGMALDSGEADATGSTEGYERWFDYALSKNPNITFMIGVPWIDYPSEYNTTTYTSIFRESYPNIQEGTFTSLRAKYPNNTIINNPYGLGIVEARLLFEAGGLPDVTSLFGGCAEDITGTSSCGSTLFTDYKGHGGEFVKDLSTFIWLNRIYGVDLSTLSDVSLSAKYTTDITAVAKSVLDAYDAGNFCGTTTCSICNVTTPCPGPPPPSSSSVECTENATACVPVVENPWVCQTGPFVQQARALCPLTCEVEECTSSPPAPPAAPSSSRCAHVPVPSAVWSNWSVHLDLNYSTDDVASTSAEWRQALDLYETTAALGPTPVPVAVFVHGGGWAGKSRKEVTTMEMLRGALLARGFTVASIGYRLTGEAPHPTQIDDVETGVQWLKAHAQTYNLDVHRFIAIGQSAGAHLVSLLGTHTGITSTARVAAVVNFYGPTIIVPAADESDGSQIARLLDCTGRGWNESSAECAELAMDASPYHQVDPTDVPFLTLQGMNDTTVPYEASEHFDAVLANASLDTTLIVVPGAGHEPYGILTYHDPFHPPNSGRTVFDFTIEWIEDHAWCPSYPGSNPPSPPPPPLLPPPAPPCVDDPPYPYTPATCENNAWACSAGNDTLRNAFHTYCPRTCQLCVQAQVSFTLAQATQARAPAPAARMLTEGGAADGGVDPPTEAQLIRNRCGSGASADLSCVQLELARLIEGLQVEGSLTVTESGALSDGDWQVQVSLLASEQCAATMARVRPQASVLVRILDRLGTPVVYQVPPTCTSLRRRRPPAIAASVASQQFQRLDSALQPHAVCAAVHGAGCDAQCNRCTTAECAALCSACCSADEYHPSSSGLSTSSGCATEDEGLQPASIGLLVTTVIGWLLALAIGAAWAWSRRGRASAPHVVDCISTTVADEKMEHA